MKVRELVDQWAAHGEGALTVGEYCIRLPVEDAARVAALAEVYPRRGVESLLRDLVSAALDEVAEVLPHVHGERIISEDDEGGPIFEDAGPAARFREAVQRHARALSAEAARDATPD